MACPDVKLADILHGIVNAMNEANDLARDRSLADIGSVVREVQTIEQSVVADEPAYFSFVTYCNRDGELKKQMHAIPKALFLSPGVIGVQEATVKMTLALNMPAAGAELMVIPQAQVVGREGGVLSTMEVTLGLGELKASAGSVMIQRLSEFSVVSSEANDQQQESI